jgi:hypothetical protein
MGGGGRDILGVFSVDGVRGGDSEIVPVTNPSIVDETPAREVVMEYDRVALLETWCTAPHESVSSVGLKEWNVVLSVGEATTRCDVSGAIGENMWRLHDEQ